MSTRSHRPALVEAQDLKGAPRGQYSSKVSSASSSASAVGEAVPGILPSSEGEERRGHEGRRDLQSIGTSGRSIGQDQPSGFQGSVWELGSEGGMRGVPYRTDGLQVQEKQGYSSDPNSRPGDAGRSSDRSTTTPPRNESTVPARVLQPAGLPVPASLPTAAPSGPVLQRSESLLPSTGSEHRSSSVPSRTDQRSPSKQEQSKSQSQSQSQHQPSKSSAQSAKQFSTDERERHSSAYEFSNSQRKSPSSLPKVDSSRDDQTQSHDPSAVPSFGGDARAERRIRESSSTPRGRGESKLLTAEQSGQNPP
ncbi:hypothetical protein PGT21_003552 [Puccinia graminis f. sp. tritici]|uniref:Uncharacterized protein n=1 Tax=Puccinia graminis f. sp. tritici TaxID=56615 RepID=A0A5B0QE85_PUCGR|nr:hypothetical protein PGT21_003552 [Puccinia graminis f. sp. tritici]